MSLLDSGPDEVVVYPQTVTTDDRGNVVRVPASSGVTVSCRVQPVSAGEDNTDGQQVSTLYRLIARQAPLGPWARVVWNGREWDVIGEPQVFNGSPRTRHVEALLQARGAG